MGNEAFKRALAAIPQAIRADVMKTLEDAGNELAGTMRGVVDKRSGKLAASITVEADPSSMRVEVHAGGKATTKPVRKGQTTTYDYANAVEFGTRKMPAEPFFWPTYRLKKRALKSRIARGITKAVQTEARKRGLGD